MSQPTCPTCGSLLPSGTPGGQCPTCLLRLAMAGQVEEKSAASGTALFPRDVFTGETHSPHVLGDYELLNQLGHGGMGVIYRARQQSLDRIVAVKLIRGGALARKELVARFHTEAAAAARLQHPNIVGIYEVGEHNGQHFYSMEFVAGQSLAELLRNGPLPPRDAAQMMKAIADAIHFAHQRSVLHRDLKPSNILLDAAGQPRVADFGLAKLLHTDSSVTVSDAVIGSPNYMSPEQALGRSTEITARSDIFGLGAMLYEMLTGQQAFSAATPLETMKQVVEQEARPLRARNPALPRDLETISLKCLAKDPESRYGSAQELADELARFLRDEPIHARPVSAAERVWRWCRRKPALASLGAILMVAPVVIIATLLISGERVRQSAREAARERETTRENLYAADMFIAHHAIEQQNFGAAQQALGKHVPGAGQTDLRGFEWRWLAARARGDCARIFTGHSNDVMSVAFSPDGRWLASGSQDGWVRLWDCEKEESAGGVRAYDPLTVLPHKHGHEFFHALYTVSFSSDGRHLAACSAVGTRVWRMDEARTVVATNDLRDRWGMFTRDGELALAYQYPRVEATNFSNVAAANLLGFFTPDLRSQATALTLTNEAFCLSRDGRWLAGMRHRSVYVLNLEQRTVLNQFLVSSNVQRVALSPDGATLAIAYRGGRFVEFREPATGRVTGGIAGIANVVGALEFSPDGERLVMACGDESLRLWEVKSGRLLEELFGHGLGVVCLNFSPDGQWLATGGRDFTVRLWRLESRGKSVMIRDAIAPVQFSRDGRWVMSNFRNPDVNQPPRMAAWNLTNGLPVYFTNSWAQEICAPLDEAGFVALVRNQSGGLVEVWSHDPSTTQSRLRARVKPEGSPAVAATLREDGSEFATGHEDGTVQFWSARDGQAQGKIQAHADAVDGLRFSPDGRGLLTWTFYPREIKTWDAASRRLLAMNQFPGPVRLVLAFSPDGRECATAGFSSDVRRWDTRSLSLRSVLPRQTGTVSQLAWSPDGRTLAAASSNGRLQFWHALTGRSLFTMLDFHDSLQTLSDITFSPDGQWFAACGSDGQLHLWNGPLGVSPDR